MNKYKGKVQGIWMLVLLSHIGLCDPMDCILSVHEILQARKLEGVSISFSSGSSWPRDQTRISCIADRFSNCLSHLGSYPMCCFLSFLDLCLVFGIKFEGF